MSSCPVNFTFSMSFDELNDLWAKEYEIGEGYQTEVAVDAVDKIKFKNESFVTTFEGGDQSGGESVVCLKSGKSLVHITNLCTLRGDESLMEQVLKADKVISQWEQFGTDALIKMISKMEPYARYMRNWRIGYGFWSDGGANYSKYDKEIDKKFKELESKLPTDEENTPESVLVIYKAMEQAGLFED